MVEHEPQGRCSHQLRVRCGVGPSFPVQSLGAEGPLVFLAGLASVLSSRSGRINSPPEILSSSRFPRAIFTLLVFLQFDSVFQSVWEFFKGDHPEPAEKSTEGSDES